LASPFSRTTRALAADSSRLGLIVLGVAGLVLAAWLAWFLFGGVTVYEVSRQARLESGSAARDVSAVQAGRLVSSSLQIGKAVRAGDLLVELDAGPQVMRAAEEDTRQRAFPDQIADLRREIDARRAAMTDDARAAEAAGVSAKAHQREAAAAAEFARENERRMKAESVGGGVSEIDALRAASEARKAASGADALAADVRKLDLDARVRGRQAAAQIEDLQRTLASLESDAAAGREGAQRLRLDIESHRVRAPIDGVIGEVMAARPGAYVAEGQKLATIVPTGGLVIVARFDPTSALGRLRPGQTARMRLDGFPWAQYGVVEARVARVATEVRDNGLRVELAPEAAPRLAGILRHGLTGRVEVRVEKASPAALLLRTAGQAFNGAAAANQGLGAGR
jgi:adhesin transport system membrane fusion protein